jgi:putative chitinase
MDPQEEALRRIVEEFVKELLAVLGEVKQEPTTIPASSLDLSAFFNAVRKPLFSRLTASQVEGHEQIIKVMQERNVPLPWAAYILATAYHETAKKMQPVREGLNASDAWRKKNLRYYPWYGRGHVQLTWEENYKKADKELGLGGALAKNADLALDPEISAEVMVRGMIDGWFSGDKKGRHTLTRHITTGTKAQFRNARRIVNLMDKADLIAGHAMVYQEALTKAGYK